MAFLKYNARTMTKDLMSIPFDVGFEIYKDAADLAGETAEAENLQKYEEYIQRLEREHSERFEAPYEGNFSDEVPYQSVPNLHEIRRKAGQAALISDFIPRYKLDTIMQTWVMPQIIAYLTQTPLDLETIGNGENPNSPLFRVNGLKVLDYCFNRDSAWDKGLYHFLMLDSRSCWLKSQYKPEGRAFCSLVPLIPYAFKLNKGIAYSQWDRDTLKWVVNHSLCEAMLCKVPENLTREEILEARDQGLMYKTGAKAGQSRNPVSTYKLYDTTGTRLYGLPELAQTMIAQIWCAHPENRTKYMVLDPENWDRIPTPLVSQHIFKAEPAFTKPAPKKSNPDMPWL
jgi:hypothetical protein